MALNPDYTLGKKQGSYDFYLTFEETEAQRGTLSKDVET